MTENYKNYIADYKKYWTERFTWKQYDKYAKPTISVVNFIKTDLDFISFLKDLKNGVIKNVKDFFKVIDKLGDSYVLFCKATYTSALSSNDEEELKNFFKGSIGEFFFMTFLSESKTIFDERKRLFKFDDICLPPLTYKDNGVDALCTISNLSTKDESHSAAIQFKFWSPFSKEELTLSDHGQKLYAEAIGNDFVDSANTDILIFVWTGNSKRISKQFKTHKFYNKSVFIDMTSLDTHINDKDINFWTNVLVDKFNRILDF